MSCQYHHSDLYCDITLYLAIKIDTQLKISLCSLWNQTLTSSPQSILVAPFWGVSFLVYYTVCSAYLRWCVLVKHSLYLSVFDSAFLYFCVYVTVTRLIIYWSVLIETMMDALTSTSSANGSTVQPKILVGHTCLENDNMTSVYGKSYWAVGLA